MITVHAGQATHVGRVRSQNQDFALVAGELVAVADGMGGHAGGEVAAQMAIESLEKGFSRNKSAEGLHEAARAANSAIFERSEHDEQLRGMGTTLTAAALVGSGARQLVEVINIGDSRAYVLEEAAIVQITTDHRLVEEMVRRGEISVEQALTHPHRNIVTRALGIEGSVEIDSWHLYPHERTRLLLCTDGLTNECSDQEIARVLVETEDPQRAADTLVQHALSHGGGDNITVVVMDLTEDDELAGASSVEEAEPDAPTPEPAASAPTRVVIATSSSAEIDRTGATPATLDDRSRPFRARTSRTSVRRRASSLARADLRLVTPRVALFAVAFVAILGGIAGFTTWFNDATYYVGLSHGDVAIFEGRPGGLLWFRPSVVETTNLASGNVLAANLPELRAGILESSFEDAKSIVTNLTNEQHLFGIENSTASTTTTTTTTIPPSTTTTSAKATPSTKAVASPSTVSRTT